MGASRQPRHIENQQPALPIRHVGVAAGDEDAPGIVRRIVRAGQSGAGDNLTQCYPCPDNKLLPMCPDQSVNHVPGCTRASEGGEVISSGTEPHDWPLVKERLTIPAHRAPSGAGIPLGFRGNSCSIENCRLTSYIINLNACKLVRYNDIETKAALNAPPYCNTMPSQTGPGALYWELFYT